MKNKERRLNNKLIEKLNGTNRKGPNCWNATLLALRFSKNVEYTECRYMEHWLANRTVGISRLYKRKIGDILVIRALDKELLHTAVYVGDGLYWHKAGYNGKVGYERASLSRILNMYGYIHSFRRYK